MNSKNKWYIGSFYTKNTPYEKVFNEYLKASCIKMNLEDKLLYKPIPDFGNWYSNTAYKPLIISQLLNLIKNDESLVFLDADATIEKYPVLFDEIPEDIDLAYHSLSWREWYGYNVDSYELLSGTLFLRNTKEIKELCSEWYRYSALNKKWEQKVLQDILEDFPAIKSYKLPIEYCYIKSRPGNLEPLVKKDPVILHHQVSRIYRKGSRNDIRN